MSTVEINQLVHVIWGEEQEPVPALVTEVINEGEFRALVRWPGLEENQGPFRFYNSDLDRHEATPLAIQGQTN